MKTILAAAITAVALPVAASGWATLDFEEFNPPLEWGDFQQLGNALKTKGYSLETTYPDPFGFSSVDKSWMFNGSSTALTVNYCGAKTTLKRLDNGPFHLRSMDLDEIITGSGQSTVTFIGTAPNGTVVQYQITTNGTEPWNRYRFPYSFRYVKSVSWMQGDCLGNAAHMFDNILVEKR